MYIYIFNSLPEFTRSALNAASEHSYRNTCVLLVKLKFVFCLLCGTEWWRTVDSHSRSGAAFFPPLLGISPLFAPPAQNHDSTPFHPRTTGKNTRGSLEKGNE